MNVHPKEYKSRLGSYSYTYFYISEVAYSNYIKLLDDLEGATDEIKRFEIENSIFDEGVKTIIFSALSVESAINDYAAWQLGDKYFDDHISSMDVVSKWIVVPKLVYGSSIDKSGPAYSALKHLIKSRNELIHNKSRNFDLNDPSLAKKLLDRVDKFKLGVENAYKAIILLSLTMDDLIGVGYNPLPSFDESVNIMLDTPPNLKRFLGDYKKIISNMTR